MTDLVIAFASTIGPAIIQKPAALGNWFALLHSTAMVEKDNNNNWLAARKFLHDTLADSVSRRVPFNAYDSRIIDAVTRWARSQNAPAQHHAPAMQNRGAAAGGGAPAGQVDARADCCKDWNFNRCNRAPGTCNRVHECMWLACKAPDKKHRGVECAHKPPPKNGGAVGGGGGRGPPASRRN